VIIKASPVLKNMSDYLSDVLLLNARIIFFVIAFMVSCFSRISIQVVV